MEAMLLTLLEQSYDVGPARLTVLAEGEKPIARVQRATMPDWVVRLYPGDARANIADVAGLLTALEGQRYPAERVVPTLNGELTLQRDGSHLLVTTYCGAPLQAWQPAQALASGSEGAPSAPAPPDHTALAAVGALLGRLHALDGAALAAADVTRNGIDPTGELAWAKQCLAGVQGQVPPHLAPLHARLHADIEQVRAFEGCPRTLIHGDCHLGNVVMQPPHDYAFVDWDAAGWGYAVTDLGLLLSSCTLRGDETSTREAIEAAIEGYCTWRVPALAERACLADAIRFRVLATLACAFEERMAPGYSPMEQFYGLTYDEWLRHEERAATVARFARELIDRVSTG